MNVWIKRHLKLRHCSWTACKNLFGDNFVEMSECSSRSAPADRLINGPDQPVNPEASKRVHSEEDQNSSYGGLLPSSSVNDHDYNGSEEAEKKRKKEKLVEFCYKNFSSIRSAIDGILGAETKQLLPSLNIDGVAALIKDHKVNRVIVMCGAGISTSAGIPDFRSPGSGLYDNLEEYHLPDRLDIFNIEFFKRRPEPFFAVARKLFPKNLKPTPSHYFIRLLDQKGFLMRCFTQNIDSLEYIAGLPSEKIVTAHGSYNTGKCLNCRKSYSYEWMQGKLNDATCKVFRCERCDGIVKPDIVFFGENLPERFFKCAAMDFPQCDLLIIMGTSLIVQPFASMVNEVGRNVPRLLINLTEAGKSRMFEGLFGSPCLNYGGKDNYRDVFWKGTCDNGVRKLSALLGWEDELEEMIEREWSLLDAKFQSPKA